MYAGLALAFVLVVPSAPPPDDGAKAEGGRASSPTRPGKAWGAISGSTPRRSRWSSEPRVVLREGYLEHFMCSKGTKEHEAILATDAVPHQIHAGLLLTGAEPGHPVRFVPKFEPPTGSAIAIELRWQQDGQIHQSDARQWVKDEKAKAPLAIDWVFAGSELYRRPRHEEEGLRRRRGRPDHRRQLRQRDPRPADRQLRRRCRPRVRHEHREDSPARHRGLRRRLVRVRPKRQVTKPDALRRADANDGLPIDHDGHERSAHGSAAISRFEAHTKPQSGEIAHPKEVSSCSPIRPVSRLGASHDIR